MRSGQQNKRGRGRNNNNGRKNGNPLSRTYDSTGPDVKIRGTAQHIADKYAAMARDALGAGDTVMAENYLQHAEHYSRIIAAAQAQMQERYQRDERDSGAEREQPQGESPEATSDTAEKETVEVAIDGTGPQPVISGTPAEVAIGEDAQQQQPARRSPLRRRAPSRPRRSRSANDEAPRSGEETALNGGGAENEAPQASEPAPGPSEAQDSQPEVAVVARDA
ncbi:DUF4167 domain-containing protein [Hoeflea poritis]|uniref:DUF4167 domain-containing protein n=1 Tax=Hoeflea poritis TaxID=2993659 RepID=A0ABT4VMB9_9HYPH|nr:DUF4167 domain-containing protein [Hoeflea poritis]MDA4845854.1 DUF4167 domain-containing protein [Hoeflea poritis]